MPRIGMNPSRSKSTSYRPARVTVGVLVHIPYLAGYYEGRWDVLRACLESLRQHTPEPYDLLVFDNGSCREITEYLQAHESSGFIRYLFRSHTNLGKIGALKVMVPAAPGELFAYSDDDFYFEPGWLSAQLEIVDTFPKVGMVSGYIVPTMFAEERISATLAFGQQSTSNLQRGKFLQDEWIMEWAMSTGREVKEALKVAKGWNEYVISHGGVEAFATANHDQFLAPRGALLEMLPPEWSGHLMGDMLEMDERFNRAGYLRLATRNRTTRHLGNILPPELGSKLGLEVDSTRSRGLRPSGNVWGRVLRLPLVRMVLLGIYSRLFHWINPE